MESKDKQERWSDCGEYVVASVEIPAQVSTTGFAAAVAAVGDAADYVLLRVMPQAGISVMENDGVRRQMVRVAEGTGAVMVYGYYAEQTENGLVKHPVIDCHEGSVRDDFDCGPLWMVKRAVLAEALAGMGDWHYGALYALRLYLMRNGKIVKFPSELCRIDRTDMRSSGEKQFDYVNPRNREVQVEMERIFTEHLHETGAYLTPRIRLIDPEEGSFEVEASVIIPVRNRERTVADAVKSALAQKAGFEFNVIVVDNHSTDATGEIVESLAAEDSRVVHIVPENEGHGIGGCWNIGVCDPRCGRYAVQLDSDDIYKDETVLQKIVDKFRHERCAMVIGSYELVDFNGNPIPPGLIDHREWTDENGANNALRINGLGAPRAFFTPVFRRILLPDVSYGEDYAMGLRISRSYRIGRIYESLYLCRRWEGNSDAALSVERVNANNAYKDSLRCDEIEARRRMNSEGTDE